MKFLSLSMLLVAFHVYAADSLVPGEYLYENGGDLVLKKGKNNSVDFEISTFNSQTNTCSLEGTIKAGETVGIVKASDPVCKLNFVVDKNTIEVTPEKKESCEGFCGLNAMYEGKYTLPPEICQTKGLKKAKSLFKKQYGAKNYEMALKTLSPILEQCEKLLDPVEKGWIQNDLALTHHKMGEDAICLKILAELESMTKTKSGQSKPMAKLAKATRTNLKLCSPK